MVIVATLRHLGFEGVTDGFHHPRKGPPEEAECVFYPK